MFSHPENERTVRVIYKKQIFSAHRKALESVLLDKKEDIVSGITRKTGSGPEVTTQTAHYYQGLLECLIKHKDQNNTDAFQHDYEEFIKQLKLRAPKPAHVAAGQSRSFTERQKSTLVLRTLLESIPRCEVCGGMFDPEGDLQHDHIVEYSMGGKTLDNNQRLTHPFCNNQRDAIEKIKGGEPHKLPGFINLDFETGARQLSFFDDPDFM